MACHLALFVAGDSGQIRTDCGVDKSFDDQTTAIMVMAVIEKNKKKSIAFFMELISHPTLSKNLNIRDLQ